jgi:hypothetical protein
VSYAGIVGFARVHGLRRLPAGVWLDAIIAGAGLAAGTDTSCLPTGGLSAEADREADIGTTTTSSSAVPERSSSSDTMMAGRLFPGSPARAAPSETSQKLATPRTRTSHDVLVGADEGDRDGER